MHNIAPGGVGVSLEYFTYVGLSANIKSTAKNRDYICREKSVSFVK